MAACRQARFVAWTLGAKRRRMGFCKKHILHCSNRNPAHTYVFSASIDDAHGLANVIEKCDSISKMANVGRYKPKFAQRQAGANVIKKCEAFRRWQSLACVTLNLHNGKPGPTSSRNAKHFEDGERVTSSPGRQSPACGCSP